MITAIEIKPCINKEVGRCYEVIESHSEGDWTGSGNYVDVYRVGNMLVGLHAFRRIPVIVCKDTIEDLINVMITFSKCSNVKFIDNEKTTPITPSSKPSRVRE